jgi:hypothetical protein
MSRTVTNSAVRTEGARMHVISRPDDAGLPSLEGQANELLEVLSLLHTMLQRLLELAGVKLSAMRTADAAALQRCAAQECDVLARLFEEEGRRDAVLARLAQSLPGEELRGARFSDIAERLPEPFGSRLRARTAGMRRTVEELRRRNRLAAEVARHLHDHIRAVFEDVARVNQESVVYGPSGKHEQRTKQSWVDAVG